MKIKSVNLSASFEKGHNAAAAEEKLKAIMTNFTGFKRLSTGVGIEARWKRPDGTDAAFTARLNANKNLLVEFTENLAEGHTEPAEDGKVFVVFGDNKRAKVFHEDGMMYGFWCRMDEKHTVESLIGFVDVLLS